MLLTHTWNFLNLLETSFYHPWNFLETQFKHPWNTLLTPLKILETHLRHPWNTLKTLFLNTVETPLANPWNSLRTHLNISKITLETPLKQPSAHMTLIDSHWQSLMPSDTKDNKEKKRTEEWKNGRKNRLSDNITSQLKYFTIFIHNQLTNQWCPNTCKIKFSFSFMFFQTADQIHDMEEKRKNFLKMTGKEEKKKTFKSADQLEREKQDQKWNTAKVKTWGCSCSTFQHLYLDSGRTLLDSWSLPVFQKQIQEKIWRWGTRANKVLKINVSKLSYNRDVSNSLKTCFLQAFFTFLLFFISLY